MRTREDMEGGVGKMTSDVTVVIISRNGEGKIEQAIKSCAGLTDKIVVVNSSSTDNTKKVSKKLGARVYDAPDSMELNYDRLRNFGLRKVKTGWLFYLDDDERFTGALRSEVKRVIKSDRFNAYAVPRKNMILGKHMKYGGESPDFQRRLFYRTALKKWTGRVHEQPELTGELGHLTNLLIHEKHKNIGEMMTKTNEWSEIEADMLEASGHPKMAGWRLLRVMFTEVFSRLVMKLGFLDGPKGVIYSFYQGYSKMVTYTKLWERQIK